MHTLYRDVYGNKKIDYPVEFHYAIVLNKWIFKQFKNEIGLIGGTEKINIIKKLMGYEKCRNYLNIDKFTDYIEIPEKFACDKPEELDKYIEESLKKQNQKIFCLE